MGCGVEYADGRRRPDAPGHGEPARAAYRRYTDRRIDGGGVPADERVGGSGSLLRARTGPRDRRRPAQRLGGSSDHRRLGHAPVPRGGRGELPSKGAGRGRVQPQRDASGSVRWHSRRSDVRRRYPYLDTPQARGRQAPTRDGTDLVARGRRPSMAADKTQGLQTREGRDIATTAEATRPGVLLTPPVDIFEDLNAITVLADMPGVGSGELKIDLHDSVLTITGHAAAREGSNEVPVLHEYPPTETFQRSFTLSEAIDQEQIRGALKHGVLRLRLAKVGRGKAGQIAI